MTRTTRMVVVGGVAVGTGLTAMAGIATAATSGSAKPTTPPAAAAGALPGLAGRGGPPGLLGGPGAAGTITAIKGSTLTLRTMNGTETVDTSSSTTFSKELQTIKLSGLSVGNVVGVQGKPVSTSTSSSKSPGSGVPAPDTGTVDATRVVVIEPTFFGRVLSDSSGVITLAGRDGQLLTVHTTSATRYYRGRTAASSSVVSDGIYITAEGTRTSLTNIDAAVIAVAPSPPAPDRSAHLPHPPAGGPGRTASTS